MPVTKQNPPGPWIALTAVQILFGVNYVISKILVTAFPPLVWTHIRIFFAALGLVGIAILLKRKPPRFDLAFLKQLVICSALGVVLNQSSFLTGLRYTTATNSAILSTLIPVFTLLFVTISGKEALTLRRLLGFFCALVGVLVIRKVENLALSDQTLIGDLLTILNCILYGLFLVVGKKFIESNDPFWMTALLFSAGAVGMIPIALPSWVGFHWPEMSPTLIACMTFSIFGSTLFAYLLNTWALTRVRSSSVALFIYLQPVVASIIAWIWLSEVPTPNTIIASVLIFMGMFLGMARA